jgi:hypothetical protein
MYKLDLVKLTQANSNQLITLLEPQSYNGKQHHIHVHEIGLTFRTSSPASLVILEFFLVKGQVSSLRNKLELKSQTFEEISDLLFYYKEHGKKILPFGCALKVNMTGLGQLEEVNFQLFYGELYEPSVTELLESL